MKFDDNDLATMGLCTWREAEGEGPDGWKVVCWVIKNRVGKPGFPSTIHDVIYQANAFSSMSRVSDPRYNLAPQNDSDIFLRCINTAREVIEASYADDPTRGSLYYANLATMDQNGWFARNIVSKPNKHPVRAKIGAHTCYA